MPIPEIAITAGIELGKLLIQAYVEWSKQQGMTAEQAAAHFLVTYTKFMEVSEKPIDEVNP